jgi:predicted  nucleic acid-binding Zn-ribbon protein
MGKKKTKKKPTLKSASKKKTKKTIQRGGFPFGFNPILKDNVEIVIKDGLDKGAYAQRNKVLPTGHGDWFSFDFNNIYDNTYNFFNQTPIENPVKTVKIALNTETDVKKINLLNKIIRKYNSERNIRLRREKMMQKGGAVVAGEIGLSKDILSSVLKTLDPRETKDAQELIDHGVFDKLISKQSEPVVKRQLSEVDKKHEELVEQNRKLMEEIRNQKRAKEKEDNEEFKKTQNLFAKPENFDKMSEKEKIEYAVNLADKLLNTKTIELLDRMQKRKIEQNAEAQKRASSQAAEKLYEVEQERKAALIQKRNLEIENSLISQRLSKLELGKKIIQEQLDKIVVEKNNVEAELLKKTADLTKVKADLQKEIDKVTEESNKKEDEIKRLDQELAKLQQEKNDADGLIKQLENDLKAATTTIADLRKDVLNRIKQIDRLDAEIIKKDNERQKVGEQLKKVRANLQAIKGKESDAQNEVLRLKQLETDLNLTLTDEQTKVQTLNTELRTANDEVARLDAQSKRLALDKVNLNKSVTNAADEITKLRAEKAQLAKEKKSVAILKRAAEIKVQILTTNLQTTNDEVTQLMGEKQALEQRITTAETDVQTLTGQVTKLSTDLKDATNEIDNLTKDKTTLETEVTTLKQTIDDRTAEKEAAEQKINALKGNNSKSSARIRELLTTKKDLEKENADLRTNLQTKKQELDTANDEITQLKEEIDKKKDEIKNKEDEITRINGDIATANGNNTSLTNDNTELTNKIKDLEKEIQRLNTQGPPAAAGLSQSAASTQSAASVQSASSSNRDLLKLLPEERQAVYREQFKTDPAYREKVLKTILEQFPNFTFPEELSLDDLIKNTILLNERLSRTTDSQEYAKVGKSLEVVSEALKTHPEQRQKENKEDLDFITNTITPWAKYCQLNMKMFIPTNILELSVANITTQGGYSNELASHLFTNDPRNNCIKMLVKKRDEILKTHINDLTKCDVRDLDFIEAVALYANLPEDSEFTERNKTNWKKSIFEHIKTLYKTKKIDHNAVYNNQVPTVDLDTGLLDISFKTDDMKKNARLNELKELWDQLPKPTDYKPPRIFAPNTSGPNTPGSSTSAASTSRIPMSRTWVPATGEKVLYNGVEYFLEVVGGGMSVKYKLYTDSSFQNQAKKPDGTPIEFGTLNFKTNLTKVTLPSSSASASSNSASSTTAPKATVNTQPQFDPKVGDTVKYINKEYIVKSMESITGAFGTVTNYKICPKDIGCGVNDENVESVPKIQLKRPDPPPTAP